jgi:DNA-binding transcriptional regulator YiaG
MNSRRRKRMTRHEAKDIRKKLKKSQQEFATLTGYAVCSVQAWESGKRNVSARAAQAIRDASLRGNRNEIKIKKGEVLTIIGA